VTRPKSAGISAMAENTQQFQLPLNGLKCRAHFRADPTGQRPVAVADASQQQPEPMRPAPPAGPGSTKAGRKVFLSVHSGSIDTVSMISWISMISASRSATAFGRRESSFRVTPGGSTRPVAGLVRCNRSSQKQRSSSVMIGARPGQGPHIRNVRDIERLPGSPGGMD